MDDKNISGFDAFEAQLQKAISYIKNDAPVVIGTEAVKHFKNAFRVGGLAGKKWADRKTPRTGSTNGQGPLVLSGDLMESIDYRVNGMEITIYSDLLYAEIHNYGGNITVTPKMKKFFWARHYEMKEAGELELAEVFKRCALSKQIIIEQRQFMGDDPALDEKIINKLERDLDKIFGA